LNKDNSKVTCFLKNFLRNFIGVIIDENGFIVYLEDEYAKILGINQQEAIGQYCKNVIPGTRMHIVANTGKEEIGVTFRLKNGEYSVVNRVPIKEDDKVVGAACFVLFAPVTSTTMQADKLINRLKDELADCKKHLTQLQRTKYSIDQIIGNAPAIKAIKNSIHNIAQTKSTVLISGETGTGKELFAHAIHQFSSRSYQPLVMVNCAAIPAELFESELFGYEEGAFTGARRGGKIGKFEFANGGTLVLDEIHQLSLSMQPKLLRVLQEKEIERVGSNKPVSVDVRLIFITNRNIQKMVNDGEFREDLFYRINIVPVEIPPLRERLEDLPVLTENLIKRLNHDLGLNISGIDPEVLHLFRLHNWPGNVRELEHVLERAANIVLSGPLTIDCFTSLSLRIKNIVLRDNNVQGLESTKRIAERNQILEALTQTRGNVSKACDILNVSRSTLYEKIKRYSIEKSGLITDKRFL
jgi:transcriptional regulator with PAS, ATPase and Fis domain